MNRILFKYELKRTLFSKANAVMFTLALLFSVFTLYTETIQGVSGTAPFSPWSYSKFLCDIHTIVLLSLMFSVSGLFSKNEQRVREVTSCTSLPQKTVIRTKSLVLFTNYLIQVMGCILISLLFYKVTFQFVNVQSYLLPIVLLLFPAFMFVFGTSLFLGSKSQALLFTWIPIVLIGSWVTLGSTVFIDVFAKGYVTYQPSLMPVDRFGEPVFRLAWGFIWSRLLFTLVGAVLYAASFKKTKKWMKHDQQFLA